MRYLRHLEKPHPRDEWLYSRAVEALSKAWSTDVESAGRALSSLGTQRKRRARRRVFLGESAAWVDVQMAMVYEATDLLLLPDIAIPAAFGPTLAYLLALRQRDLVQALADTYRTILAEDSRWSNVYCSRFLVHLADGWLSNKEPSKVPAKDLGPFGPVVAKWHDEAAVARALLEICEYHTQSLSSDSSEFQGAFPFELAALRIVREDLGIETPAVDHALLNTPLAEIPTTMLYKPAKDPDLQRLMKMLQKSKPALWKQLKSLR